MAHIHRESETYYLDQLCLVALSGAFGGVCLSLYFWQRTMLTLILGGQFHLWVLGSGIVLVLMAVIRAGLLWASVGKRNDQHALEHHSHDHHDHHPHDHAHEACDHEHEHGHHLHEGPCPAGHAHQHEHHHHHEHDHNHDHDHDHDWAPWRYVVLLIPILLFLIGLPNEGPQVAASAVKVDLTHVAAGYATLVECANEPLQTLVLAVALTAEGSGPAPTLDFKRLEEVSQEKKDRDYWAGKRVKVTGQFAPSPASDRIFSLVRFKIRCCAADAVPLNVPMISKESVAGIKEGEWVEVSGRLTFQKGRKGFITVMQVAGKQAIVPTNPDANPWVPN